MLLFMDSSRGLPCGCVTQLRAHGQGPSVCPGLWEPPHVPSHLQVFIHCRLSFSLFLILYQHNCWECVVIRARKQSWLLILLIIFRRNMYFENNLNNIHSIYCSIALLLPLHYHFHPVVYSKWINWLLWEEGDVEDVTVAEARFWDSFLPRFCLPGKGTGYMSIDIQCAFGCPVLL